MTKIRSTDGSNIDDVRGQGGGGMGGGFPFPGGFPGGGGGGGLPIPTKAGGGLLTILLLLAAMFLPKILGRGQPAAQVSSDQSADVQDGTCTSELEQVVCGVTNDVQAYWTKALPAAFGQQYQPTKLTMFSGGVNTGCGAASSQTGPFYCPLDSKIYVDLSFMQQLETMLVGKTSDLAEQYIVAHEFGHHVQNVLGLNAKVQEAQQQDPGNANKYSIALELQADCFAGAWVGDANARGKLDSPNEIDEALAAAEGVGDDRIQQKTQGRVDPESWTHGSAQQRQQWFLRGFKTRDPKQCNTFNEVQ